MVFLLSLKINLVENMKINMGNCHGANQSVLVKLFLLTTVFVLCGLNKLYAQVEGQYDTLNIGTIDTSLSIGFISNYEQVEIIRLDEMVTDLNDILEIPELSIATKYSASIKFLNTFNYDLVFNSSIRKPTSSCACLKINFNNTIVNSGSELTIQIEVLPIISGNRDVIIELPILKKSLVDGNQPTIVAIKPIKLNFKVK